MARPRTSSRNTVITVNFVVIHMEFQNRASLPKISRKFCRPTNFGGVALETNQACRLM